MMTDALKALESAKTRRGDAHSAVAAAEIRAGCDAADVLVCEQLVQTVTEARAGLVAAAKTDDVIRVNETLVRARVTLEIAVSRAAASTAKHAAAVAELHDAGAAVTQAARCVVNAEMADLAAEVVADLDAVFAKGERLRVLSLGDHRPIAVGTPSMLPTVVTAALERLPRPDDRDIPMHILRGNGGASSAWTHRLEQLTADA